MNDRLRKRQEALARLGQDALQHLDLDQLLRDACREFAEAVAAPMSKIGALTEDGGLLLVATFGIPEDIARAGTTTVPGGTGSALGYAVAVRGPVLSNVETETRFHPSEVVLRAGVKCSLNVVIWADREPYGSLEVDSRSECAFTEADIGFLQLYANVIGAAVERWRATRRAAALMDEREALLKELMHRVKNLLTNILAIAQRTSRYSRSVEEFTAAFEGRIGAVARAQDMLLAGPDQAVQLRELLRLELDAKGVNEGRHLSLNGPDVVCTPRTVQILALLVHELATNAVKYGALSPTAGSDASLKISWSVQPPASNALILSWRESGVELSRPTARHGFGSEIINSLVPHMLGGDTRITRHPDGIECVIQFPLTDTRGASSPMATAGSPSSLRCRG